MLLKLANKSKLNNVFLQNALIRAQQHWKKKRFTQTLEFMYLN